MHKTYPSMWDG